MEIIRASSRPTKKASSEYFTGIVWQDPIIEASEPARVRALRVAFEPGARTAWHTHPLGQTLYVLSGIALMGLRNKAPQFKKLEIQYGYHLVKNTGMEPLLQTQ